MCKTLWYALSIVLIWKSGRWGTNEWFRWQRPLPRSPLSHVCFLTCSLPSAAAAPVQGPPSDTAQSSPAAFSPLPRTEPPRRHCAFGSSATTPQPARPEPPYFPLSMSFTFQSFHLPRWGQYCLSKTGWGHLSWETQASCGSLFPRREVRAPLLMRTCSTSSRLALPPVPPHLPTLCTSATENTPCPLHIGR